MDPGVELKLAFSDGTAGEDGAWASELGTFAEAVSKVSWVV